MLRTRYKLFFLHVPFLSTSHSFYFTSKHCCQIYKVLRDTRLCLCNQLLVPLSLPHFGLFPTYKVEIHMPGTRHTNADEMTTPNSFLELTSPNHTSISKKSRNVSKIPETTSSLFGDAPSASNVTSDKKKKRRRRGNARKSFSSASQAPP